MPGKGPPPTAPCGTPSAARRHYRRGEKPCPECQAAARASKASGEHRTLIADVRERRNGLPFRPYVYRGSGADAYTGEVVEL